MAGASVPVSRASAFFAESDAIWSARPREARLAAAADEQPQNISADG